MEEKIRVQSSSSKEEINTREVFFEKFKNAPIPDNELLTNLGLFISRQTLSRILFMQELYSKIISVHGIIMEFGVRWGQNLSLFSSLRGIYEPFNYNRKIVGFDTFSGFPILSQKDGNLLSVGDYSVSSNYEKYLEDILEYHEKESPVAHKRKFQLVKGDASVTLKNYFENNTHTIVAMAYFDFDIYEPTKDCLGILLERVTKGSVIVFDELNCPEFPGETIAVMETIGLSKYAIKRSPLNPLISYIIID